MAEGEKSTISEAVDSVIEKFKSLPAAEDASTKLPSIPSSDRLFCRERSVHELLGGGKVADIILWREAKLSAAILACVTIVYIVFEWLGCHVLSVLSIVALVVFGALFLWSNAAAFVKRSRPDVPRPQVSEDTALHVAAILKDEANLVMNMLHEVVIGKDIKLFLKVELGLWILSLVGKWADFLTLVYLGVVLVLTVPVLYERHEDKIDRSLLQGFEQTCKLHRKLYDKVLKRVPQLAPKQKKVE